MRPPRPVQPRPLGGMGSGAPQCTIAVHDPSKGEDMMKWCSYDHTSFGQGQQSAANVLATTNLAHQDRPRAVASAGRAVARRPHSFSRKKK